MELYFAPDGDDGNAGTEASPKRDPSKARADAIWLKRGGVYWPKGRVKLGAMLGAYGSGYRPVLHGGGVQGIAIDAIDAVGATVQDINITAYRTHGIHAGLSTGDPAARRALTFQRLGISNILGERESYGIQAWGAGITYSDLVIDRVRADCLWHSGVDITIRGVTLLNASALDEGIGDCLQTLNLRDFVDVRGLTAIHNTPDKQAVLLSGSGTLKRCVIDGLTAEGYASGAGLVTIQGLRGIVGKAWNITMRGGPSNTGVFFLDGASGTLAGGSLIGFPGAVAVRGDGGFVFAHSFSKSGWQSSGVA